MQSVAPHRWTARSVTIYRRSIGRFGVVDGMFETHEVFSLARSVQPAIWLGKTEQPKSGLVHYLRSLGFAADLVGTIDAECRQFLREQYGDFLEGQLRRTKIMAGWMILILTPANRPAEDCSKIHLYLTKVSKPSGGECA